LLMDKYSVLYLDYSNEYFPKEEFYDHDHLNDLGAGIFTKQVMMDLDSLNHPIELYNKID